MAAYKIGNFTFDTEEEYARGLEDAKKIEKIQNTVDLNEPETALRLYWLIRTGKIKFGSKVDVYLPPSLKCTAKIGQKVAAGQTVIAVCDR